MPIASEGFQTKYVPAPVESHAVRINMRAKMNEMDAIKIAAGSRRRKIILIAVGTLLAAGVCGGVVGAVLALNKSSSSTASSSSTSSTSTVVTTASSTTTTTVAGGTTTTGSGTTVSSITTTAGGATTATTTTIATTTTTTVATTTGATTTTTTVSTTTVTLGPPCIGLGVSSTTSLGSSGSNWVMDEQVSITNNRTLSNLTVTIYSIRNTGVSYNSGSCTDQNSQMTCTGINLNTTYVRTLFTLQAGQTIGTSGNSVITTINIPSSSYSVSNDTYVVTARCNSGTSIITGHF